jgi:hypothetical protein
MRICQGRDAPRLHRPNPRPNPCHPARPGPARPRRRRRHRRTPPRTDHQPQPRLPTHPRTTQATPTAQITTAEPANAGPAVADVLRHHDCGPHGTAFTPGQPTAWGRDRLDSPNTKDMNSHATPGAPHFQDNRSVQHRAVSCQPAGMKPDPLWQDSRHPRSSARSTERAAEQGRHFPPQLWSTSTQGGCRCD